MRQDVLPGIGLPDRFDPLQQKIFKSVTNDAGAIEHGKWLRAKAEGHFVGHCRRCGDSLIPLTPRQVNDHRTDYQADCRDREGCGWSCLAPGGRYLFGSARKSERRSS